MQHVDVGRRGGGGRRQRIEVIAADLTDVREFRLRRVAGGLPHRLNSSWRSWQARADHHDGAAHRRGPQCGGQRLHRPLGPADHVGHRLLRRTAADELRQRIPDDAGGRGRHVEATLAQADQPEAVAGRGAGEQLRDRVTHRRFAPGPDPLLVEDEQELASPGRRRRRRGVGGVGCGQRRCRCWLGRTGRRRRPGRHGDQLQALNLPVLPISADGELLGLQVGDRLPRPRERTDDHPVVGLRRRRRQRHRTDAAKKSRQNERTRPDAHHGPSEKLRTTNSELRT